MFITETWIAIGDMSPFSELIPRDCKFFNTPRSSGRGGGLVSIFKEKFNCRLISTEEYQTFERQLLILDIGSPVAVVVIYRPPKAQKDFINEFGDFLGGLFSNFDKLLILGDFNIHVCCPENVMSKDFLNLMDSFDLTQLVNGPTHIYGHTIDLVLTHGLFIEDLELYDHVISDHKPILFNISVSCCPVNPVKSLQSCRSFSATTGTEFSTNFNEVCKISESALLDMGVEEHLYWLYSTCKDVLDAVAPQNTKQRKVRSDPWLNNEIRGLRRICRQAERKWKKYVTSLL